MSKRISVMIVEDSRVVSEYLTFVINSDPRLEVIKAVKSGEEALETLRTLKPDVISLDIRLPGMNGLEATTRIMSEFPTPIVVVASDIDDESLQISMHALSAGALAVVQKPVGLSHKDYLSIAQSLCTKLAIMSEIRVIRQRFRSTIHDRKAQSSTFSESKSSALKIPKFSTSGNIESIGIVASTGGPRALVELLSELQNTPPIFLVQHITPSFTESFTQWLNDSLPNLHVKIAIHGEIPANNTVYVAPAEKHLRVHSSNGAIDLVKGPTVSSQCPSGTVLLESLAHRYGKNAIGIILTGMGDDGASGIKSMHQSGAYTIAESESTAIVFGMPKVAILLQGVSEILPLPQISSRVNQLIQQTGEWRR